MPRQYGFIPSNNEPDQAQRRVDLILEDKHGREYHVVYDTAARGVIRSYPRFNAPWMPEEKHLKYVSSRGGGAGAFPDKIEIDYDEALAENHREQDRYFDEFLKIGGKIGGVDAMTAYSHAKSGEWEKVPKVFFHEIGSIPQPDEFIKAAMAGNKWALGLSNTIPAWALPLVALEEMRNADKLKGLTASDLDKYADEEEAADPDATGGKKVKVGKK
jgi:hypothetical protein